MLSRFNKVQEALNETLFTRATGVALTRIATMYGFPRPLAISPEDWRSALRSAVFSARGTPGPIFRFLELAFQQWTRENSTFTLQGVGANSVALPLGVTSELEGRFCRINGELYRSSYREGSELFFYNVNTPLFKKALFEPGESYDCAFLPFDIVERDGIYRVLLDDGILGMPPTYLKQDASEVREGDEPFGGQLLDFTSDVEAERFGDPLGEGAFPAYLGSDDFTAALGEGFLNLLCIGIFGEVRNTHWANGLSSLYGSYKDRVIYGTTTPSPPDLVQPTRG